MRRFISLIILTLTIHNVGLAAKIKINTTIDLPEFNFYVDSVIVVQEEKNIIGHQIEYKKLYPLSLEEKKIAVALQNIFRNSFPKKEDQRYVIVKVNRIIFNTFEKNSEFGINITFIENVDGSFHELGTIQSFWLNENTLPEMFPAYSRGYDLVKCLAIVCRDFVLLEASQDEFKLITREEVYKPIELNTLNFPIIEIPDRFTKGVLFSFENFINADVMQDQNLKIKVIDDKKTKYNKVKVESSSFPIDSLYGVYDGKNYYVKVGKYFRPLIFHKDKIYVHAPARSDGLIDVLPFWVGLTSSTVVVANLGAGKTFGELLLMSTGVYTVTYLITSAIVNASKKYVYYEIDLLTGLANQSSIKTLNP